MIRSHEPRQPTTWAGPAGGWQVRLDDPEVPRETVFEAPIVVERTVQPRRIPVIRYRWVAANGDVFHAATEPTTWTAIRQRVIPPSTLWASLLSTNGCLEGSVIELEVNDRDAWRATQALFLRPVSGWQGRVVVETIRSCPTNTDVPTIHVRLDRPVRSLRTARRGTAGVADTA